MAQERLQKLIAQAGFASRRKAELLITGGKVKVNGKLVTELGSTADILKDKIEVDGQVLEKPKTWEYVLLYKPAGVVTSAKDEFDRQTVIDLVKDVGVRVFPVGRLDFDAEGLLLLTNDGNMAAALTHPSGYVPKTYCAKVKGKPTEAELNRLREGIVLEDGLAVVQDVEIYQTGGPKSSENNAWVEVTVTEGRNHLIKRLLESVGHPVIRLRRVRFANLVLDRSLEPGKWRRLTAEELRILQQVAKRAKALRNGDGEPMPKEVALDRKGRPRR